MNGVQPFTTLVGIFLHVNLPPGVSTRCHHQKFGLDVVLVGLRYVFGTDDRGSVSLGLRGRPHSELLDVKFFRGSLRRRRPRSLCVPLTDKIFWGGKHPLL